MKCLAALLALGLAFLAHPAAAQQPDPTGLWALRAEGRILWLIELRRDPHAPGGWSGGWVRPEHFTITAAHLVSGISGPPARRPIVGAAPHGRELELLIGGERPEEAPDRFVFRLLDAEHAELAFEDAPLAPFALDRAPSGATLAGGWEATRAYSLDAPAPSNAEMTAIFEADQADRRAGARIDLSVVGPRDEARRTRTRALLAAGALRSGADFLHAAFVFQHGSTPDDFLFAHTLAVAAVARGRPDGTWIAAATLDRYLQRIGRPQIYGTQFQSPRDGPTTQEPYDRNLVSDALRQALGVPDLAGQERQRAQFEAEYRRPQPAPAAPPRP